MVTKDFPGGARGKESACQFRRHKRHRFDPWGQVDPLKEGIATHSCQENPMDRGAWQTAVYRVAKNWT